MPHEVERFFEAAAAGDVDTLRDLIAKSLSSHGNAEKKDVRLWFYTDKVDELYELLRARQIERGGIEFVEDIYDPFYGGRQFSIRDLNGYDVIFYRQ